MAENEADIVARATDADTTAQAGGGGDDAQQSDSPQADAQQSGEPQSVEAQAGDAQPEAEAAPPEEITYHAVERDGQVAAIWEMQGRKHLRTIDPRARLGQEILRLYTAEQPAEGAVAAEAAQ